MTDDELLEALSGELEAEIDDIAAATRLATEALTDEYRRQEAAQEGQN
jgi:hypothetical protein